LPETNNESALFVAERLRHLIEEAHVQVGNDSISITASIGVATLASNNMTLQELINAADSAMYKAKDKGRNSVGNY